MSAEERVAEVLAAHKSWTNAADGCMGCGWKPDNFHFAGPKHMAHVAAELAAAGLLADRANAERDERLRAAEEPSRKGAVLTMHYVEGWLDADYPDASRYLRTHIDEIADQMVDDECAAADPEAQP